MLVELLNVVEESGGVNGNHENVGVRAGKDVGVHPHGGAVELLTLQNLHSELDCLN